jgi:phosphopantetheinyl transferase
MDSIRDASAKSNHLLSNKRSDRTKFVTKQRRNRRSATRPNFVEGWRKAIGKRVNRSAAKPIAEQKGRIDVWIANTRTLMNAQSCLKILTEDDWASLARLQDPSARYSAIAAKVLLRLGLSRAVDYRIAPSDWQFGRSASDKPILVNTLTNINFSVSHVDEFVAVAVSPIFNVGIDIESVDRNVSEGVIDEFYHVDEQRSVRGLPPPQRTRELIRLWTLKEAYSKMIGLGHSLDFKMIKFLLDPINLPSENQAPNWPTQFEKFYVAVKHTLFHGALAIQHPARHAISTEVQIISLVDSEEDEVGSAAPLCC